VGFIKGASSLDRESLGSSIIFVLFPKLLDSIVMKRSASDVSFFNFHDEVEALKGL